MEPLEAAVDMILVMASRVQLQLVRLAVDDRLAARDAVRVAANDAAHRRIVILLIGRAIRIAQQHIHELAGARHDTPAHEACAEGRDPDLRALRIAQRIQVDGATVRRLAECFFSDFCHGFFLQILMWYCSHYSCNFSLSITLHPYFSNVNRLPR